MLLAKQRRDLAESRPQLAVAGLVIDASGNLSGRAGDLVAVSQTGSVILTAAGQRALRAGTLSANPLSCTASYHAVLDMDRTDPASCTELSPRKDLLGHMSMAFA